MYVDSQAGAGFPYHYICDKDLFITMRDMHDNIEINGYGAPGGSVATQVIVWY